MRSFRTVAAGVVAVAALAVGGVVVQGTMSADPHSRARNILEASGDRCFKIGPLETGGEVVDCLEPAVNETTVLLGAKRAMDLIVALGTEQDRWGFCHRLGHIVAHAAVVAGETYPQLASAVSPDCNMGFEDGVIMAVSERYTSDGVAGSEVLELCSYVKGDPEIVAQCGHGFGHVMWERHHGDVTAALEACRNSLATLPGSAMMSGKRASAQCVGGVTMSIVEEYGKDTEKMPSQRPLGICTGLLDGEMEECVADAATFDAEINGALGALDWCHQNASASIERCAGSIGYWAANTGRPVSDLDICAKFGVREKCLISWKHRMTTTA